jgi:hypothetical protein
MRLAIVCSVCVAGAIVTPALSQDYLGLAMARDAERAAAAEAARLRDISIGNDLSRLEAQAQTNQALSDLAILRARPALPSVPLDPRTPPVQIDVSKLASIPDSVLADSNAKVLAAAQNRR